MERACVARAPWAQGDEAVTAAGLRATANLATFRRGRFPVLARDPGSQLRSRPPLPQKGGPIRLEAAPAMAAL